MSEFELENKLVNNVVTMSNLTRGINVKDVGLVGDGTTDDYTALNVLITSVGSVATDIYLPKGTYKLSSSITIPSNVRLIFESGAMLSLDSTKTVTINGAINAGVYQIFTGASSTPVLGKPIVQEAYAEWFGAKGDAIVDCTYAINMCLTVFDEVSLQIGRYKILSTINISSNQKIIGNACGYYQTNDNITVIQVAFAGIGIYANGRGLSIKDIHMEYGSGFLHLYTGIKLGADDSLSAVNMSNFENIFMYGALVGWESQECYCCFFTNIQTDFCTTGMKIYGGFNANDVGIGILQYQNKVMPTAGAGTKGIDISAESSINNFHCGEISGYEYAIYYNTARVNKFSDIWCEWNLYDVYKNTVDGELTISGMNAIRISGNTSSIKTEDGMGKNGGNSYMKDNGIDFTTELKSYLVFNSTNNVYDYSKNYNSLNTNTLVPTLVDSIYGKAWRLSGQTNGAYSLIPASTLDITKPITLLMNFKFNSTQSQQPEFLEISDGARYLRIRSSQLDYPFINPYTYNGSVVTYAGTGTTGSNLDTLKHEFQTLAITLDVPNNTIYSYNLLTKTITTSTFAMSHITGISVLRLFLDRYGSGYDMDVNYVMLYNRVLDMQELTYIANQQALIMPVQLMEKNNIVNVRNVGLVGDGTTNDYTILNKIITSIGSTKTDLYFPRGTYKLSTNITIPSNIRMKFENGAILSPDASVTMTINGEIEAGVYQIFGMNSATPIAGVPIVQDAYPEWFGAIANQSYDCTVAINTCLASFKTCKLSKGYYKVTDTINIGANYRLRGNSSSVSSTGVTSFLYAVTTGTVISVIGNYFELKDFTISPDTASKWQYTGIGLGNVANEFAGQGKIENITVVYGLIGFDGQECYCVRFTGLKTYQCKTSMKLYEGFNANDVQIDMFGYGYKAVTVGNIGIHILGGSINRFHGGEISGMEHGIYYDCDAPNAFSDIWFEWNTNDLYKNSITGMIDFQCNAIAIAGNVSGVKSGNGFGKCYQRTLMPDTSVQLLNELKGYYIFDSVNEVFDYSYNNNTINSNTLNPTLVDGLYGKCWSLNGQTLNSFATLPTTTFDVSKPITVAVNLKFNATQNSYPEIIQIIDGAKYLRIRSSVTAYPAVMAYTYNGTTVTYCANTSTISSGVALRQANQTLFITLDIPNNKLYTYQYGYREQVEDFTMSHITNVSDIRLFLDKVGADANMNINWMMLYNRKLNINEIDYLRSQQVLISPPIQLAKKILNKPARKFEMFEDFNYQTMANTYTPWILNNGTASTPASTPASAPVISLAERGVVRLLAGNKSGLFSEDGSQLTYAIPVQADSGSLTVEARLKINSSTPNCSVNFGLTDTISLEEPFEYKTFSIANTAVYTSSTWAEWSTKPAGYAINTNYINISATPQFNMTLAQTLKPSTKYGVLYDVRSNTRNQTFLIHASNAGRMWETSIGVTAGATGNFKQILTTIPVISINAINTYSGAATGSIEYGDIRIFELPIGSQIEADFTNLTATQLFAAYASNYTASPIALKANASDGACFLFDNDCTTKEWLALSVDSDLYDSGNGTTSVIPVADTYQILRIEVSTDGNVISYYINDILVKTLRNAGVTPNVNLYATISVNSTTTVNKVVDIDYITVSHNR